MLIIFKTHNESCHIEIVKTITSSGTSNQGKSRINLYRHTSVLQSKSLSKIVCSFTEAKRLPLLIFDSKSILREKASISARSAGILGFSLLSRDLSFALDDEMKLDFEQIDSFCVRNKDKKVLIFGFTYILWKHLYLELEKAGTMLPLDQGILFHGGGWKHLVDQQIGAREFKKSIERVTHIQRIHNYYGMAEQTGSIFVECQFHNLHCPIYSDIKILRPDFSQCAIGEIGLVQVDSILPWSYPGHSVLTEDRGEILGIDDCPCGRLGKYVRIHGRIENSEIKGCSDSYAR